MYFDYLQPNDFCYAYDSSLCLITSKDPAWCNHVWSQCHQLCFCIYSFHPARATALSLNFVFSIVCCICGICLSSSFQACQRTSTCHHPIVDWYWHFSNHIFESWVQNYWWTVISYFPFDTVCLALSCSLWYSCHPSCSFPGWSFEYRWSYRCWSSSFVLLILKDLFGFTTVFYRYQDHLASLAVAEA